MFDVKAERLNRGLTQRDLARECDVSLPTIQRLEGGATATPSNAKKVADFFGIKVTDLPGFAEMAA